MSVGLRPAAQSSNPCKARRYPERARRSAASIWACSSSGISSKVVSGIVGLLDIWVLGYIQHIIRAPHCANLMHSDLETSPRSQAHAPYTLLGMTSETLDEGRRRLCLRTRNSCSKI